VHFIDVEILGAKLIEPSPHLDERGKFMRAWCEKEFEENEVDFHPIQANIGFSVRKGTVRGMHFQDMSAPEAKLVRCTRGAMFDVVLDLRPDSTTYCQWYGTILTPENGCQLFIPPLCAHGYQTLEEDTEMYYMTSASYTPAAAHGVRFDDPAFQIDWPLTASIISEQDRNWPLLETKQYASTKRFPPHDGTNGGQL
jgi:dTDP-4-dehydrorhamnose 3,5-epimerase